MHSEHISMLLEFSLQHHSDAVLSHRATSMAVVSFDVNTSDHQCTDFVLKFKTKARKKEPVINEFGDDENMLHESLSC